MSTRFVVASDLHVEFHADGGRAMIESLAGDVDGAIVAGDLADSSTLAHALDLLCERYRTVIYVHGNHEFYGSDRASVQATTASAARRHRGLHVLDGSMVSIGGRRILGVPLWFRHAPHAPGWFLNDFRAIAGFESWVYAENARAIAFLERELSPGDVVVTHHLPSQRSVAPQWANHPLNPFFVCELDELITARRPALWIHGHTHDSIDARIGATRVICNPFGYAAHEENRGFDPSFVVDL